jgi:hypothetical protein
MWLANSKRAVVIGCLLSRVHLAGDEECTSRLTPDARTAVELAEHGVPNSVTENVKLSPLCRCGKARLGRFRAGHHRRGL